MLDASTNNNSPARAPGPHLDRVLDVQAVRRDFPALSQLAYGKPLVHLDNAATTQKPQCVLDAISAAYVSCSGNVHRGVHLASARATAAYEHGRDVVQRFLGAAQREEIIFVRGATEAINLVAHSFGQLRVKAGDEILITAMEHHANIVPWQLLCQRSGAILRVVPMSDAGELDLDDVARRLTPRTRLLGMVHVSNALGTVNPVAAMCALARARGIATLVDGAQAVPHMPVDVQALDCDFYCFSGHKVFGPSGIGVLYGRRALLETLPPYQGGGDMIAEVRFEGTTYNELPYRFEAGTPHIAGVLGLTAALDYLTQLGRERIAAYENDLLVTAEAALRAVPGLHLVGSPKARASVLSFTLDGVHAHDVGTFLDRDGIATRSGHHCAQPAMRRMGVPATARASIALYNTTAEIEALAAALTRVQRLFAGSAR